ncbi:hypothetical protein, partial [Rivihabitans pingtungensis]|uniref:hypothetical protein n=1 Tax=Rivihabitans pingtungensis TaxID=1054498 RepID=UPI0023F55D99
VLSITSSEPQAASRISRAASTTQVSGGQEKNARGNDLFDGATHGHSDRLSTGGVGNGNGQ